MNLVEFRRMVKDLGYGKRLQGATYVIRLSGLASGHPLIAEIARAELAAQPREDWNLLKLHTGEYAITFLSYPDFDKNPHPALAHATKINLNTGRIVRTDYSGRANPPILHRKETFLPPGDLRFEKFAALTKAEEAAGLYREPSKIGLRIYWETLLRRKGLRSLVQAFKNMRPVPAQSLLSRAQPGAVRKTDTPVCCVSCGISETSHWVH